MNTRTQPSTDTRVDVVEVATAILMQGARRETMVSQEETRALAAAVVDFSQALTLAAHAVHLVGALSVTTPSANMKAQAENALACLEEQLKRMGFHTMEGKRDAV